jgi:hypothetical protein
MTQLTPLILALIAAAGDDAAHASAADDTLPHAVQVLHCNFAAAHDRNYDGWPDGWIRRRGRDFPAFIKIGILPEFTKENASTLRYLQMELSGGSAGVVTPLFSLGARGSFYLEAQVRTKQLKHDQAYVVLTFCDDDGTPLETHESKRVTDAPQWQTLRIGPLLPKHEGATQARIALHVAPSGEREDLVGEVQWTALKMLRLPRIALRTNSEVQVYDSLAAPEVICDISGLVGAEPELKFELLDHQERVLASESMPLVLEARPARGALGHSKDHITDHSAHDHAPDASAPDSGLTGSARWKPPIPNFGFYRVRVSMQPAKQKSAPVVRTASASSGPESAILQRTVTLAVLRSLPKAPGGEFGWSLPGGENPLPLNPLATLLNQSGLGWAKYPVWFSEQEPAHADRLAWFAERLSIHGIELVGVLDQPPASLRETFRDKGHLPTASIFEDPQLWQGAVDPVLTRLSLKVRWWQLGNDLDSSYVDFPALEERIQGIKTHFERFGQQVHLGIGWRWLREPPAARSNTPWEFLSYSAEPELTAEEIAAYLPRKVAMESPAQVVSKTGPPKPLETTSKPFAPSKAATNAPRAWVVLTPLPRSQYTTSARTFDLVQRMLAARQHNAGAVFVPQPFSDEQGLLNADGSPGELYVPWCTTATLLGGTQYLGSLPLAGGSVNHVFARDGHAVMVLWNDQPGRETFFLGHDVKQIDVWGREQKPQFRATNDVGEDRPEMTVEVGPEPTFLFGLDEGLTRWQIQARFITTHLESIFGRQQAVTLRLENSFPQGVSGTATLHAPKSWTIAPQPLAFRLAQGEIAQPDWFVSLQPDAASGQQRVRIDFDITAERNYRFSVYRMLQLGLDDVTVEMRTRIREDGLLLVEQHVTNLTGNPISFQCLLFPPGRRRETKQLLNLPAGRHTVTFLIPQGESLIGQSLWLRAEEIGGPRVLNSTVVVER